MRSRRASSSSRKNIERISRTLAAFLQNTKARGVLLVDKDGPFPAKEGDVSSDEMEALFESSRRLSRALGVQRQVVLRHERDSVWLSPVEERTTLAVIYGDGVPVGMIQVSDKLAELFAEVARRGRKGPDRDEGAGSPARV